ncbi:hypothetical protein IAR55_004058 [Kwoniella newhampshirensis]|uniref:Rad21/Rec8-like protein N-terminal domain-containing protein n=1 Tax=Kwoniella newhampshirensis TaxID=1651941 RepID=A0AAW0YXZ5_9TREE
MFFSDDLLTSKKGSFGIVWLMATLGPRNKKITRKQLTAVDLAKTCDLIAQPPEPLALRLSGALLVGVARVYNQNYEIFYSDVSTFHSKLRRSIETDFNATTTGPGSASGVDLPSGGKSKPDQITFAASDFLWDTDFDFEFRHVDWNNPFGTGRKRRASSQLSSQATQTSQQEAEEQEEEDDQDQDQDEEEGSERGRDYKRKKLTASPALGAFDRLTKTRTSIHHPSDTTGANLYASLDVPFGEEVDLGLDLNFDAPAGANDSFSGPSGRGLELPHNEDVGAGLFDAGFDMLGEQPIPVGSRQGSLAPHEDGAIRREVSAPQSTLRRSHAEGSLAGSHGDLVINIDASKKKRTKKVKKVTFDSEIELSQDEERNVRRRYAAAMEEQRSDLQAKESEKTVAHRATAMVDSLGGLRFFDPEMNAMFSDIAKVPKFKWELDMAAHRLGKQLEIIEEEEGEQFDQPDQPQGEAFDVFGGGMLDAQNMDVGYQDVFQDYEIPIRDPSVRQGSEALDLEYARRANRQSQQGPLPWEERARARSVTPGCTTGFHNAADSSFSATSLRLSIMTPQEARLRLNSRGGSTPGLKSAQGRGRRSGSLVSDRADDDPLLLVTGHDSDFELFTEDFDLESLPASQQARLEELPKAFRPEMLATLEKQCRDFFTYVERKMITLDTEELAFTDVAPVSSTKHVAALAFYDCLTLVTKKILSVNQPTPWENIEIRFAVEV